MNSNSNHPAATRQRIDALCDAFEAAWRAGQRPSIEAELEKIESAARHELLKELLLVEWELLGKQGAPIRVEEYVARFPEHETLIHQTLGQRPSEARFPEVIAHYKILKLLGAGGMGEVFLAEDRRLGRKVALKLLPEAWARDRQRRQRFLTEARAASSLNHPNVCIIHEVGETAEGQPYLTMEFLEGGTLDKRVAVRPLTVIEIVNIAIQIADALEAAIARGVVHRDLKPANISINDRGLVKVLDFGLAKIIAERPVAETSDSTRHETQAGAVLGTPITEACKSRRAAFNRSKLSASAEGKVRDAAKLRRAVEHAGLTAHQQGAHRAALESRKDFVNRVRDQGCLLGQDTASIISCSRASAPVAPTGTIPAIHPPDRDASLRPCHVHRPLPTVIVTSGASPKLRCQISLFDN